MARHSEKRLEDWIRLILLNWVLISMIMFYSILIGIGIGYLVIGFSRLVINCLDLPAHLLDLVPTSGPTTILVVGGMIAAVFLHLFSHLHYDCQSESYALALSKLVTLRVAACFVVIVMILLGIGTGFGWLFSS